MLLLCALSTDAVSGADLARVGQKLLQSIPAYAAIGDLTNLPSRRSLERTLFSGNSASSKAKKLFSFR